MLAVYVLTRASDKAQGNDDFRAVLCLGFDDDIGLGRAPELNATALA
jgi:hypothetical protein